MSTSDDPFRKPGTPSDGPAPYGPPQGGPGWGAPPPQGQPDPYGGQGHWGQGHGVQGHGVQGHGVQGHGGQGWGSGWDRPPETSSRAVVALVLAIGSFVVLPLFAAVAALFVAAGARREIRSSGGRLTGEGLATAAVVVSWINIALCLLFVVAVVGLVALAA